MTPCGKQRLGAALLMLAALFAIAWKTGEELDVQTLDGYFYAKAKLMSVNDGGITVLCADPQGGDAVLRGISFDRLPQELRTRFGYDPEKFAAYQKTVGTYRPPEEKKPAPPPAPEEKTAPQTAEEEKAATGDVSKKTLAPYGNEYVYTNTFWYRPTYWFGPGGRQLWPRPRPRPGPKPGPKPCPGPRPKPMPRPQPCPGIRTGAFLFMTPPVERE